MNAVFDEDLHRSLALPLFRLGFTVLDIRDHRLRSQPDDVIFHFAQTHSAVLFSGDLGFANTLQFPLGNHFGICILRFPNEMTTGVINREVQKLLTNISPEDYPGNLLILSPGKLRVRTPKKKN